MEFVNLILQLEDLAGGTGLERPALLLPSPYSPVACANQQGNPKMCVMSRSSCSRVSPALEDGEIEMK